jgi:hypothetical protein
MSLTPKALKDLLDELELSTASRKRAWENLQESRWVVNEAAGVEVSRPVRKALDFGRRIIKDGVRKALNVRHVELDDLVKAIRELRMYTDEPLPLRAADYARAVQKLNKAVDQAGGPLRHVLIFM